MSAQYYFAEKLALKERNVPSCLMYSPLAAERTVPRTLKPAFTKEVMTETATKPEAPDKGGQYEYSCSGIRLFHGFSPVTRTVAGA